VPLRLKFLIVLVGVGGISVACRPVL